MITRTGSPSSPSLLAQLAKTKFIPLRFLSNLGIKDSPDGILIPYRDMDSSLYSRQRIRKGLKAKDGFQWLGAGQIIPYGLWRLESTAKYLILVEGESDCWALWYHGFEALGLPGATMSKTLEAKYFLNIKTLHIWQEPDNGGKLFASGIAKRLHEIGCQGIKTKILEMDGTKDPSEIHIRDRKRFKKIIHYLMLTAESLPAYIPPEPKTFLHQNASASHLTEDQIRRAREYPLEEILEVKKGFFIICPYHPDTRPSMWIKSFGYCFVCGKSMNSISYLRETKGFSFKEAVLALQ